MKFNKVIITGVVLAVLLSGCAVTDIDREADFSRLKSYSWGKAETEVTSPVYKSELIDKKIRATVASEFRKKGIVLDESNPDFLVNYYTHTEKREQREQYNRPYPFYAWGYYGYFPYGFYRPWSWGVPYMGGPQFREYEETQGTLVLDIVDAKTLDVIWRGTVSGNVDNLKALQRQVEKGVRAILRKYPAPDGNEENILPPKDVIG